MATIVRIERVVSYRITTDPRDLEEYNVERLVTGADNNVIHCYVEAEREGTQGKVFTINIDVSTSLPQQKRMAVLGKVVAVLKRYNLVDSQFHLQLRHL